MVEHPRAGAHYPRSTGRVPGVVPHRCGLPGLPGVAALAGRVRLPVLRSCRRLAAGRRPVSSALAVTARTSVTAGTIFDRTRTPLTVWFTACWLFATAKGRHLGAEPAAVAGDRLLPDRVGDAAPAAVGAGAAGPGPAVRDGGGGRDVHRRGGAGAARRAGPGQEGADRHRGRGRRAEGDRPVPDGACWPTRPPTRCSPFVTGNVEPGSTRHHRRLEGYNGLAGLGYAHERRSQRAARARGEDPGELLPAVHRVASLAKRWLLGTHQGSVDAAHLQAYLNEFVFRFNRRRSRSRGMVFYRVLELAAGHDPVRYDDIRATRKPRSKPPQQRGTGHPPSLDRPAAARPWRTAEMQLQFPLRLSGYPGVGAFSRHRPAGAAATPRAAAASRGEALERTREAVSQQNQALRGFLIPSVAWRSFLMVSAPVWWPGAGCPARGSSLGWCSGECSLATAESASAAKVPGCPTSPRRG